MPLHMLKNAVRCVTYTKALVMEYRVEVPIPNQDPLGIYRRHNFDHAATEFRLDWNQ
jgi:hypothetical protein